VLYLGIFAVNAAPFGGFPNISRCVDQVRLAQANSTKRIAVSSTPASGALHDNCNQPTDEPVFFFKVSGHPFEPVSTHDGCFIFLSLLPDHPHTPSRIAVIQRSAGQLSLIREVPVKGFPTGMILSHDGKMLIAATGNLVFLDTDRLLSGRGEPVLGYLDNGIDPGSVYVNVTRDDKYLFVSNENAGTINVIDLEKARRNGFDQESIVGDIPVGPAPVALSFSPDEKLLYTTIESARAEDNWPNECESERQNAPRTERQPAGAVLAIDVEKAKRDPANSVVARTSAGCSPVRLALSPTGNQAYVTARNSNAVMVLDTRKLLRHASDARIATVPVGASPVGISMIDGRRLVVANSDRFSTKQNQNQILSVIDVAKISVGSKAVIGRLPAGSFPREIRMTQDGRTILVTNFNSNSLEVLDVSRLSNAFR
jgi:YVTN family beta-propeller protein